LFVKVTKGSDAALGMELCSHREDDYTIVAAIREHGIIAEWNEQNPSNAIRPGDRLLSVNGVGGRGRRNYWALLGELKKSGPIMLTVSSRNGEQLDPQLENLAVETLLSDHWVIGLPRVIASESGTTECSICLDALSDGEEIVRLPCHHMFHLSCATKCFQECMVIKEAKCPLCRQCPFQAKAPQKDNHGASIVALDVPDFLNHPRLHGRVEAYAELGGEVDV